MFEILWRRRWTILVVSFAALAGGALYLHQATPLYTSTSRICVEQAGPQVFERDTSGMITRWDNYIYTQAERLQSTEILSAALAGPDMGDLRTLADSNNPIGVIRRGLTVNVGKKDEILNVSFKSVYPDEAAHIVNSIVDAYITVNEKHKRSTFGEVVRVLREEKSKRGEELVGKLAKMVEFRRQNEGLALGTDGDTNIIVQRLGRLSAALTEAQLVTAERASWYEAAKKMSDRPSDFQQLIRSSQWIWGRPGPDAEQTVAVRNELARMEKDRDKSLEQLKADHPAVVAVDAEIERTRRRLDTLDAESARSLVAIAEQEYVIAKGKEQELEKRCEQQRQEAIQLNNQLAQYSIYESDYEQTKRLCDLLDNTIQRLDVSTEVGTMNISILETAEPSARPSEPQMAKTMGLSLCLGLCGGLALSFVREWRDQRLRSTQEIAALLDLPVLGAIPAMSWPRQTPAIRGQKVRINPDSREAEAFRTVRTAIYFGAPKEEARTIVVTSPMPGEGKSTVIANLGIAMAQAGQKVLVLDADLRSPMQHKIFTLDRQARGLGWVLAGEMALDAAVEHTGLKNLDVLTCGPEVSNPAEVLNSEAFSRLLATLAPQYDRVLIDSPPVIVVADALILAALCDAAVLVLHAGISTRQTSVQAYESLASVGAKVLGVVVNDVPARGRHCGPYYASRGLGRRRKGARMKIAAIEDGSSAGILIPRLGDAEGAAPR
jgi:capsular exopolysaccharide synthesis family protein